MDLKAEFDKLRKTATEGLDQAKGLAGGLAEKAVEAVQDRVEGLTGKMAGSDPVKSWNSTVSTTLEGKNAAIRLPFELIELVGWKDKEIVTFSLLQDGSVHLKKYVAGTKT